MSHLKGTYFRHEADDKQRWLDAAEAFDMSLSEFIFAAPDHTTDETPSFRAAWTR